MGKLFCSINILSILITQTSYITLFNSYNIKRQSLQHLRLKLKLLKMQTGNVGNKNKIIIDSHKEVLYWCTWVQPKYKANNNCFLLFLLFTVWIQWYYQKCSHYFSQHFNSPFASTFITMPCKFDKFFSSQSTFQILWRRDRVPWLPKLLKNENTISCYLLQ